MSDAYLLVPLHLDAMVLDEKTRVATSFSRFQMDYGNLQFNDDPEPPPFGGAEEKHPKAGTYLHWTLPQALRHGIYRDDGTTEFPLVPNRWLVIRQGGGDASTLKAWVLESDYLGEDGTSPFVDPHALDDRGLPTATNVGRALRLTPTLTSLARQDAPFLRAIGPGNALFSVYSPGAQNVLAFYDDMTRADDATPVPEGDFVYSVLGWYSDPERDDPLKGTGWSAEDGTWRNDTFDWRVNADAAPTAERSALHGMVSGVPWPPKPDAATPPSYPTHVPDTVKVAVGNTAIDALAAIVRTEEGKQAEADLLEMFQYGLLGQLDAPGSSEALDAEIRRQWFGASSGGTHWSVVAGEEDRDPSLPAPAPPPLTPAQREALDGLNAAQLELDRQQRLLESRQRCVFDLWWKQQCLDNFATFTMVLDPDTRDRLSSQLARHVGLVEGEGDGWTIDRLRAQRATVDRLGDAFDAAAKQLDGLLTPPLRRKATPRPPYHRPNDPVVLVTGLGRSRNFDPTDGLVCRSASQVVDALTVGGVRYGVGGKDVSGSIPPLPDPHGLLPSCAQALEAECFFLSPEAFAQRALGDAGRADEVSKAYEGTPFLPAALAMGGWEQPWVPLLLDWKLTLVGEPAYDRDTTLRSADFVQSNWGFDGRDYVWKGPTQAKGPDFDTTASGSMKLSGRTFVTPHLPLGIAAQLDAWLTKHSLKDPDEEKDLEALNRCLKALADQDVLSQRLSGLTAMLVQRRLAPHAPPVGQLGALVGDQDGGVPQPYPDNLADDVPALWELAPLRGTFFVIDKLTVVDSFGRTVDLMEANHSDWPNRSSESPEDYFYPIAGRGLRAPTALDPAKGRGKAEDATQHMLQLPPRLVQDSQLDFALVDEGADAARGALQGWFVPNHLDRSLACYSADGVFWGEAYLSRHAGGQFEFVWQPDPSNPDAPTQIDDIPNPAIRGILAALREREDDARFGALLGAIDETLWTVTPRARRDDQDLSVLVGRPLAVVRSAVSLRLRGTPYVNQDWWNTFEVSYDDLPSTDDPNPAPLAQLDGGVLDRQWPVRLGSVALRDDGLIGFYRDDPSGGGATYEQFFALLPPKDPSSPYVAPIGPDTDPTLRPIDDTTTDPDPARGEICRLTMIVDPRSAVHAYTGLLPVQRVQLPPELVESALRDMSLTFRAGPVLSSTERVCVPRPAEQQGRWWWLDSVTGQTALGAADGKVRLSHAPVVAKEGWMSFAPNPQTEKKRT